VRNEVEMATSADEYGVSRALFVILVAPTE
jgi:hypothetical protein